MFTTENRSGLFSLILSLLSLIFGVPGFLYFFLSGKNVVGILTLLIVVVLLGAVWLVNQPQITVLNNDKTLTLKDETGSEAIQTSYLTLRANQNGVRMIHLANFSADGSVKEIKINGKKPTLQRVRAGDIEVIQELPSPLRFYGTVTLTVSAKYINSFRNPDIEAYTHVVAHKTKKLSLTVNFPEKNPMTQLGGSCGTVVR